MPTFFSTRVLGRTRGVGPREGCDGPPSRTLRGPASASCRAEPSIIGDDPRAAIAWKRVALWFQMLSRRRDAPRAAVRGKGSLWAMLLAVVLVSGTLWVKTLSGSRERRQDVPIPFNSVEWKSARLNWAHSRRRAMVDSLLESRMVIGMTFDEAWEALGPPDVHRWSDQYPYPAYRLGTATHSEFDSSDVPLLLVFGDDGRVQSVTALR